MGKLKISLDWIAIWLLIIAGINWGLYGIFNFNFIQWAMFETGLMAYATWAYVLIGLAAIWLGGRTPPIMPFGRIFT